MRLIFATLTACAVLTGTCAVAGEIVWTPMSGAQITEALTGRNLQYERATQRFYASGRTLYNAGQDSWGYWAVRGAHYCSQWPPQDLWACYDMNISGNRVQFVGSGGDVTTGTFTD